MLLFSQALIVSKSPKNNLKLLLQIAAAGDRIKMKECRILRFEIFVKGGKNHVGLQT